MGPYKRRLALRGYEALTPVYKVLFSPLCAADSSMDMPADCQLSRPEGV